MRQIIKSVLKESIPPIVLKLYKQRATQYGFFGNYQSWQEALKDSTGYNADVILERVQNALLQVKQGKVAYSRDGVIFEQIYYSFPVLAALSQVAIVSECKLNLLDFGGSLGTSYYQFKEFFLDLKELHWSIVEQENFVKCGQDLFTDDHLHFFNDIDGCIKNLNPNTLFLSGVVQCLENPYDFLKKIIEYNFQHIIIDRTAFVLKGSDRLTIQKVQPEIYPASYPSWFLNLEKFKSMFSEKYNLVFEFDSSDRVNLPSQFKGFYFRKK
jgi:putative methyltransferase (TIGR04325 family)